MAEMQKHEGGVSYHTPGQDYFEKRELKRHAGVFSLWALGVGAVISGDFSGWNGGFAVGGWGGMFVGTIIVAVMYLGLTYSIAEMSPALPHTGGAYSFARTAFGPWGGFITGIAENIEYVLTPAVVVYFIGTYMTAIVGTPDWFQPGWWLIGYVVFVGLNVRGVALSFVVTVIVTLIAIAILLFFFISAIPFFDFSKYAMNIASDPQGATLSLSAISTATGLAPDVQALVDAAKTASQEAISLTAAQYGALPDVLKEAAKVSYELPNGGGPFLPFGFHGVLASLPFAVWLFLAIEQLPLASEESVDPRRDMPKGIMYGMFTLIALGFLVLFVNPALPIGAFKLGSSGQPILDGFANIYGDSWAKILALFAVAGLVASFHSIIFAFGRQIYSLSRAGYFPHFLSVTHGEHKTPNTALVAGSLVGFLVMLAVWFTQGGEAAGTFIGYVLLNMAVFGAMFSYFLQAVTFLQLRRRFPNIDRPYRSPFGVVGAALTAIIAVVTIYFQLTDPLYRTGVIGVGIWYIIAIVYFAAYGRNTLVFSPEEAFAVKQREGGGKM